MKKSLKEFAQNPNVLSTYAKQKIKGGNDNDPITENGDNGIIIVDGGAI